MRPYKYDEKEHGLDASTIATRRLTRSRLQKLEPWTEQQDHPRTNPTATNPISTELNPMTEEETACT